MYNMLKHAHSGLRWVFLALLVYALINAFMKWRGGQDFTDKDRKLNLFTMIFAHIQLLIGTALFFDSPMVIREAGSMKDSTLRFFLVEHPTMMILSIVLITMAYSKSKKDLDAGKKFKSTFILFLIAFLVLMAGIPWPFRGLGAGWF